MENRESKELYEKIISAPMELSDSDLANIWGGASTDAVINTLARILHNAGMDMSIEEVAEQIAQGGCTLRNLAKAKTGGNRICNLIPCF